MWIIKGAIIVALFSTITGTNPLVGAAILLAVAYAVDRAEGPGDG